MIVGAGGAAGLNRFLKKEVMRLTNENTRSGAGVGVAVGAAVGEAVTTRVVGGGAVMRAVGVWR